LGFAHGRGALAERATEGSQLAKARTELAKEQKQIAELQHGREIVEQSLRSKRAFIENVRSNSGEISTKKSLRERADYIRSKGKTLGLPQGDIVALLKNDSARFGESFKERATRALLVRADVSKEIIELRALRDRGLLSDSEYRDEVQKLKAARAEARKQRSLSKTKKEAGYRFPSERGAERLSKIGAKIEGISDIEIPIPKSAGRLGQDPLALAAKRELSQENKELTPEQARYWKRVKESYSPQKNPVTVRAIEKILMNQVQRAERARFKRILD